MGPVETPDPELAQALQRLRRAMNMTQEHVAKLLGRHPITVSRWEQPNGRKPSERDLAALAKIYGVTPAEIRYGRTIREELADYTPNPALKNRLRPKPRARVYEHIQAMVEAGATLEQIDEAERTMIDSAFNQLNKRDPRDRSDDEMIMDIDSAWRWITEVLERSGVGGLR